MQRPVEVDVDEGQPIVERVAAIDVAKATGMVCTRVPHDSVVGKRVTKLWEVKATAKALAELVSGEGGAAHGRIAAVAVTPQGDRAATARRDLVDDGRDVLELSLDGVGIRVAAVPRTPAVHRIGGEMRP